MRSDGSIYSIAAKATACPIFTFPAATAGAATPRLRRRRSDMFFRSQVARLPIRGSRLTADEEVVW
jgi:hypothetical protein